MAEYVCSNCGEEAYYDGRCGDGPVLICRCAKGRWIDDGRGGYYTTRNNAQAVRADEYNDYDNDYYNRGGR